MRRLVQKTLRLKDIEFQLSLAVTIAEQLLTFQTDTLCFTSGLHDCTNKYNTMSCNLIVVRQSVIYNSRVPSARYRCGPCLANEIEDQKQI